MSYQLELITWEDSYGCGSRWQPFDHFDPCDFHCQSAGWVIHESKKHVVIAGHMGDASDRTDGQFCGDMTIPKSCIVKRQKLKAIQTRKKPTS